MICTKLFAVKPSVRKALGSKVIFNIKSVFEYKNVYSSDSGQILAMLNTVC